MNNISELLESLSRNSNHPQDAFSKFYEFVNETIGLKLLTLTTFDISNAVAQRVYSNMPIEYPVSGIKPIEKSTWTEIVLDNHKSFIANNIENNAYWEGRNYLSIYEELITIKGIGPWTAEMFGMFHLLEKDIFPLKDVGVIRAMNQLYNNGKKLEIDRIIEISDTWRPYRSVACWFLWRSIDSEEVLY